ncbi:MAG: hypothetical protein ACREB8_06105 [Pseudolabrys sp.]
MSASHRVLRQTPDSRYSPAYQEFGLNVGVTFMRIFPIAGLTSLLLLPVANPAGACEDGDYALQSASVVALQVATPAAPAADAVTAQNPAPQPVTIDISAAKKKLHTKKHKDEYMRAAPSK